MNKFVVCACTLAIAVAAQAQSSSAIAPVSPVPVPENLGLGLKQLVEISQRGQGELEARVHSASSIVSDSGGRIVVNIHLNGKAPLADVEVKLAGLGVEIIAADPYWRSGVISA